MAKILIIGCGGVAAVAIQKCAKKADVFSEICIASRTVSKCDALKEKLAGATAAKITTAQVDADNVEELIALIEREQPKAVLNLALPYQDLTIMEACLACKVDYIDTANYEAEDTEDPALLFLSFFHYLCGNFSKHGIPIIKVTDNGFFGYN